ncbi:MAG: YkgJ family cysteine cluster protein [Minicystis sp.]
MRALPILDESSPILRRTQGEIAALLAGDLADAAARAHVAIDEAARVALARSPALDPACAAGCSWCCHVHADATVPEILAAARHLRGAMSREALAAFRDRLAAHVERVVDLDDQARWGQRIPCALLAQDGRCSIYEARPLRCRAFHSCSVDRCRDAFEGVSDEETVISPSLQRACRAVEDAYDDALAEVGIAPEGYRFEVGLLIAIDDPSASDRFRAGEDVFARARPR